ncbi:MULTISPECIES: tetratricopeptide repeat protein [Commensalibacter]|uniref:tetratricopeptide repeat protein n=1 Tax=Commensalibacter TaxID=1079922 RepID=UPI0018DE1F69|nr:MULTISPECIES: tetratricopeptide repeat protein [Commensalibacter]MBH9972453.1 tetratricopeptide repeat protein [Commensalibacter melissae]MBI0017014.1 tetratricopeptide repeat protein [Commensalibacter sp. B14384M2]MBI0018759.1 tetratricopeptide repeat protein [Commensalibacter sp. W8133]MBI0050199.1 tetratricopeptide repeat protein [Commensalibacter sp. B14384M3]MBI0179043.1 tetratricopeptide repeat protein [Commensalibacter sp. W8163]
MALFNSPSQPAKGQLLTEHGTAISSASSSKTSIIEGNQNSFVQEVVEASQKIPVLVDFWANWCNPCKQLTPLLEKIANATQGRVKLVKIDIDANQALVQQLMQIGLPIQSIPLVAAFWQGQIVDLFQGVQAENAIQQFVSQLLKTAGSAMPSADLIEQGQTLLHNKKFDEAMGIFSQALELEPEKPEAWGGLIRSILASAGPEAAQESLEQVPESIQNHAEIIGAKSAIDLALEGEKNTGDTQTLMERIKSDPDNYQARYELATALNGAGKRNEAAHELLEIMKRDKSWNDEAAKKQLLRFFESWGFDDPATLQGRRQLSTLLFS